MVVARDSVATRKRCMDAGKLRCAALEVYCCEWQAWDFLTCAFPLQAWVGRVVGISTKETLSMFFEAVIPPSPEIIW